MNTSRLEAFSDGVIAIIITIMVLEMKVPHGAQWSQLWGLWPVFLSYLLSFLYVGIYWNNHHHMLQAAEHVSGRILWANLNLLFWLSLMPFATGWIGENHFAPVPMAVYGGVLTMCALSFVLLSHTIVSTDGNETVGKAIGSNTKGWVSLALTFLGVPFAFINEALSGAMYVLVALIWFFPDRRIEKVIA